MGRNGKKPKLSGALPVSKAKDGRLKPTKTSQPPSYLAGVDLPPSDDEEEEPAAAKPRASSAPIDVHATAPPRKEVKEEERRKLEAAVHDPDAYIVTIGARARPLIRRRLRRARRCGSRTGGATASSAPMAIGKGKSTLLKLLKWQKLPLPGNFRVMLVAQEDESKDPCPVIKAVLGADSELAKLRAERHGLEASGDAAASARLAGVYTSRWPTELPGHGGALLQLAGAGISYAGAAFELSDVDATITMGLLAGERPPTRGRARRSDKLRIRLYSQHFCDSLPAGESAVQYLLRKRPHLDGKPGDARAVLGRFGLPKENHLSGEVEEEEEVWRAGSGQPDLASTKCGVRPWYRLHLKPEGKGRFVEVGWTGFLLWCSGGRMTDVTDGDEGGAA
ncbi:hypothetical protein ACP4OV_025731 [Aristida adscensionis]